VTHIHCIYSQWNLGNFICNSIRLLKSNCIRTSEYYLQGLILTKAVNPVFTLLFCSFGLPPVSRLAVSTKSSQMMEWCSSVLSLLNFDPRWLGSNAPPGPAAQIWASSELPPFQVPGHLPALLSYTQCLLQTFVLTILHPTEA